MTTQYAPTVLHTITNPDGTVSIVQVDPNNPIITLSDGTTAHVQGMTTVIFNPSPVQDIKLEQGVIMRVFLQFQNGVHTISEGSHEVVDLNSVTEATLNSDGQIILTAEDGHGKLVLQSDSKMISYIKNVLVSGVITVPVSASMYQTMVANIQHLHTNSDGTVCVTPVVQVPEVKVNIVGIFYE